MARDRWARRSFPPGATSVKPRGQAARRYLTFAQAASAIAQLAPTPTAIGAITENRTRSLTDGELRQLGRHVRAHRLRAGRILPPLGARPYTAA